VSCSAPAQLTDNAAGFAIHESIHHELPEVHAVAHSHSIFGKAFSMLGRNVGKAENSETPPPVPD
jgi:ribulose-5-phosphate 4-epimerase/fuculose-1-phosphate aldolase